MASSLELDQSALLSSVVQVADSVMFCITSANALQGRNLLHAFRPQFEINVDK